MSLINRFSTKSVAPLAALATLNTTPDDIGVSQDYPHHYSSYNIVVYSDVVGTVSVQCSNDISFTNYIPVSGIINLVAGVPLVLKVPIFAQFYRVQVINGAVLQTSLSIMTSFTQN